MNKQSLRVGSLGEGSYTEQAVFEYINYNNLENVEIVHYTTKEELVEAVAEMKVDYGVLPIENMHEGFVRPSLKKLMDENVWTIDEWKVKIDHVLACRKESLDNILDRLANNEEVEFYTHYQAWGQIRSYIKERYSKCLFNPAASTAKGAEDISKMNRYKDSVAVCSEYAAKLYDLEIFGRGLVQGINETRFLVISNELEIPEDNHNKGFIICELNNQAGALHGVTGVFADLGLNMTSIPGMPTGERLGEYRFNIEFEIDRFDKLGSLLNGLIDYTNSLKLKGYYKNLNSNGKLSDN